MEGRHVRPIVFIDRVPGPKSDEPGRVDAADSTSPDRAGTAEGIGWIEVAVLRCPIDALAVLVEHDHVEVDFSSGWIAKDEIPCAGVVAGDVAESAFPQGTDDDINVALLDHDIQVGVRSCLRPQARIHGPTAVDPHVDVKVIQELNKIDDGVARHLRLRVAAHSANLIGLYVAGLRASMVNPSFPSTLTTPVFPPSKSPEARRWPVANS
jgi:hypothetical protein